MRNILSLLVGYVDVELDKNIEFNEGTVLLGVSLVYCLRVVCQDVCMDAIISDYYEPPYEQSNNEQYTTIDTKPKMIERVEQQIRR